MLTGMRRTAAIGFAVLLVALVALVAATSGIGKPGVPDDAVAYVADAPDGEVTQEEADAAIEQAAARQGARQAPEPGTPQYDLLKETAMADVLLSRWVAGEAEELGVTITDREIDTQLESIIQEQFGGQKEFERFQRQSKFSDDDVRSRVRLQLMSERIQERVLSGIDDPSEGEISAYYDDNQEQFQTPETRDVRTVLNPDAEKAQDAFDQLSEDSSPGSWKRIAKQLSTDEATSDQGGLREGVAEGQNDPALDAAIFEAAEGEVVGPIDTDAGQYVFQVETINEASTQELDDQTSQQISQTIAAQRQQEVAAAFQSDFIAKWRNRTVCDDNFMIDRCGNAPPPPDECLGDDPGEEPAPDPATGQPGEFEGCPAFVPSTRPVPPSSAGDPTATGLPQGPQYPQGPSTEGAMPLGLPGAPQLPGGAEGGTPAPPPGQ